MMPAPKRVPYHLAILHSGKKGLEPITFGFGDQCSTIELLSFMETTGLEPATLYMQSIRSPN